MAKSRLTVVARIMAKTGMEEQVRQGLLALVAPTRSETGCINYDLHQANDEKGLFLFYENWTDRKALDEHLRTPHLQGFLKQADDLLAEPVEIRFLEMISEPAE